MMLHSKFCAVQRVLLDKTTKRILLINIHKKVAGYLSPTHCEYHYKLRRGWGSRYYTIDTIHGNGEDRVQNFRTKFLILCRELCLLTSTYLKINNLRRD